MSFKKILLYGSKFTPPYTNSERFLNKSITFFSFLLCNSLSKYICTHDGIPPITLRSLSHVSSQIASIFDSQSSIEFVLKVGKIAESEGHHPDISFGWGYSIVKISTHAIKGLAESDFVLAAKIDKLI